MSPFNHSLNRFGARLIIATTILATVASPFTPTVTRAEAFPAANVPAVPAPVPMAATQRVEGTTNPIINETDADTAGTDTLEFVELFGAPNASLNGYVVVLYNGSNDLSYRAMDLDGFFLDASGYFVLGNALVSGVDLTFPNDTLQNGQDAVALYLGDATSFPTNTPVTATNVVDAVVYDTADADDATLLTTLTPGQPQIDENGGGNGTGQSIGRCPNGSGGPQITTTYTNLTPTPGTANSCPAGGITLSINDVSLAEGNTGTTTFTFTVTLSANSPAGGVTFDIATANGTATTESGDYNSNSLTGQSIPQGSSTYTFNVAVNGDFSTEPTETFFVNVTNVTGTGVTVADGQGQGTIVNDDVTLTLISAVQGDVTVLASPANNSPLSGNSVAVRGVVTNLLSNGFFMQEEIADDDGNVNTSEGIFVFTSSAPTVTLGQIVQVAGTVSEFRPGGVPFLPTTELISPTVTPLGTIADGGAPGIDLTDLRAAVNERTLVTLPNSLIYNSANPNDPNTGIEFWETLEGMFVEVTQGTVVAPTTEFGATSREITVVAPGNAVAGSGYFPTTHNLIIQQNDPPYTNPASPQTIGGGDFNPERIIIANRNGQLAMPNVNADGTVINNIAGTVDYSFGNPKIQLIAAIPPGNIIPGSQTDPLSSQGSNLRVVSTNVENLFDTVNEPGRADSPILTPTELNTKIAKITLAFVNQLGTPDIVNLVEVENQATAQLLANSINSATGTTNYVVRSLDAADDRSIENVFMWNANRVSLQSVFNPSLLLTPPNIVGDDSHTRSVPAGPFADINLSTAFIADTDRVFEGGPGAPFSDSREPLIGVFRFNGVDILVIGVHLASKGGDGPLYGTQQPVVRGSEPQRKLQADHTRALVNLFFNGDAPRQIPAFTRILVTGDFNDFQFPEEGEVGNDALGIIQGLGVPANRFLSNLMNSVPADERYSFIFDGNSQLLDHMLVSPALLAEVVGQDISHLNADFADSFATDATTHRKYADHEALAGTFNVVPPGADLSVTKTDSPDPVIAGNNITYTITVSNSGPAAATNATLTDAVPANTTFVSFTAPAGWTPSTPAVGGTGNVTATNPSFASGGSVNFTLVVKVNPGATTTISNTATVSSSTTDSNSGNNTDTETTSVQVAADVSITKTDSPDAVVSGTLLTYTITASNAGPSTATNVTVSDSLPAGLSLVSITAPGGTVSGKGNSRTVTYASIAPSSSVTITITASVACSLTNGTVISNTATVSSASDSTAGNNSATSQTTVNNPAPVITCPGNVTVNGNTPTGAVVTYGAPTVTDNCGGTTVVCSPASGSFFPNGTTPVTCTATDSGGQTAQCSFSVTVGRPVFDICMKDDVTGNYLRAVTANGPSKGYWELVRVNTSSPSDDVIYFGTARTVFITSYSVTLTDDDDPSYKLTATWNKNTGFARSRLLILATRQEIVITDTTYFNSGCLP